MIDLSNKRIEYVGRSAVEIVRALERHDKDYPYKDGAVRQYLMWSLDRLGGTVSPREIGISDRLEDETLALGYLLLLDEYGVDEKVSEG